MIKDDNELSAVFSTVPPNQLIVLEDVDAQSNLLHKRNAIINKQHSLDTDKQLCNENQLKQRELKISNFSLSAILACLDGHIVSEGNIIIMSTNHIEVFDPACIRPGRINVHLELGYCTRYQLNKMYQLTIMMQVCQIMY
jgi:SpoVK/Ycf46/Vps4 family AAA+-type ATPase